MAQPSSSPCFIPAMGQVRVQGVEHTTNAVFHPWLKAELTAILDTLADVTASVSQADIQPIWHQWREGLTVTFTLPEPEFDR